MFFKLVIFIVFIISQELGAQTPAPASAPYYPFEREANPLDDQLDDLEEAGYRPTERLRNNEREKAERIIREAAGAQNASECDFTEEVRGDRTIAQYDQVISDMSNFILQNYSSECVANLLTHYMAEKFKHGRKVTRSASCQNEHRQVDFPETFCPRIVQEHGLFLRTYQRLADALIDPTLDLRVCSGGTSISNYEELSQYITRVMDNNEQTQECREVGLNQTRLRNNGKYLLTQTSPNNYTARIAMDFSILDGGTSQLNSQDMMDRVRRCIAGTNQFFKTATGENLTIDILDTQRRDNLPENQRPVVHQIRYQAAEFRQNSNSYQDNIDCETIAHEVFHLMGLLDEYHEGDGGFYYNSKTGIGIDRDEDIAGFQNAINNDELRYVPVSNSCRSIPETPSLMAQQAQAFAEVASQNLTCECSGENANICQNILGFNSPNLTMYISSNFEFDGFSDICSIDNNTPYGFGGPINFNELSTTELEQAQFFERKSVSENELIVEKWPRIDSLTMISPNQYGLIYKNIYRCSCEGNSDPNCREKLEILKNGDLEPYYKRWCKKNLGMNQPGTDSGLDTLNVPGSPVEQVSITQDENSFTVVSPPKNPGASILHPAQMSFIKFGGCHTRALKYRTCQSFSYVESCPDRPAYCDEEEQWLMQEQ
ncbi:MAG: hypothetical protein CME62_04085 [Halobacteriovoraceae bacterium]|nr:hypothetical protein [Halobacteriovoraceae bacterium]